MARRRSWNVRIIRMGATPFISALVAFADIRLPAI